MRTLNRVPLPTLTLSSFPPGMCSYVKYPLCPWWCKSFIVFSRSQAAKLSMWALISMHSLAAHLSIHLPPYALNQCIIQTFRQSVNRQDDFVIYAQRVPNVSYGCVASVYAMFAYVLYSWNFIHTHVFKWVSMSCSPTLTRTHSHTHCWALSIFLELWNKFKFARIFYPKL